MSRNKVLKIVVSWMFIVTLLAACGSPTTKDTEQDTQPAAVLQAQSWLAEELNVPVTEIEIASVEQVEWTDSCYGLGGPAESCAAVITPGWRALFEVNGQRYEVRFDETGTLARSPQIS